MSSLRSRHSMMESRSTDQKRKRIFSSLRAYKQTEKSVATPSSLVASRKYRINSACLTKQLSHSDNSLDKSASQELKSPRHSADLSIRRKSFQPMKSSNEISRQPSRERGTRYGFIIPIKDNFYQKIASHIQSNHEVQEVTSKKMSDIWSQFFTNTNRNYSNEDFLEDEIPVQQQIILVISLLGKNFKDVPSRKDVEKFMFSIGITKTQWNLNNKDGKRQAWNYCVMRYIKMVREFVCIISNRLSSSRYKIKFLILYSDCGIETCSVEYKKDLEKNFIDRLSQKLENNVSVISIPEPSKKQVLSTYVTEGLNALIATTSNGCIFTGRYTAILPGDHLTLKLCALLLRTLLWKAEEAVEEVD